MKKNRIALLIGALLCAVGLAGWIYQLMNGLVVTNMRNPFSWGLYIASFELFIGLATGGMLLFSIAHLFHVDSLKPFARLGAWTSLGCAVASGFIILADLGQPARVLQMLLTPNVKSPLFWDVVILGLFFLLCIAAIVAETRKSAKLIRILAIVALPYAVVLNAGTSLMFALQRSRAWWHSAILPADSVAVGVALGLSLMMLVCMLSGGRSGFTAARPGFGVLAKTAATALVVHLCFTALELIPLAWGGTAEDRALLDLLFGRYGGLYAAELLLPLVALVVFYSAKGRSSAPVLGAMDVLVMAGGLIHRMMLLYPAFNSIPLTIPVAGLEEDLWSYPISSGVLEAGKDLFVTSTAYVPSLTEWAVNLLPMGLVVLIVALAVALGLGLTGRGAEQRKVKA